MCRCCGLLIRLILPFSLTNLNKLGIKYKSHPKSLTIDALGGKYAQVTALTITLHSPPDAPIYPTVTGFIGPTIVCTELSAPTSGSLR